MAEAPQDFYQIFPDIRKPSEEVFLSDPFRGMITERKEGIG